MNNSVQAKRKFYTVQQFAKLLGGDVISLGSVYRSIQKGEIPHVMLGNRKLIPADWVDSFVNSATGTS